MTNASLKQHRRINFDPRFTASKSGDDKIDYFPSEPRPLWGVQEKFIYPEAYGNAETTASNTGAKTIKAVLWEYTLFKDASRSQVLRSYQIYTRQKIRAGETKVLRGKVLETGLPNSQYQSVRPLGIEYTDGTVWKTS